MNLFRLLKIGLLVILTLDCLLVFIPVRGIEPWATGGNPPLTMQNLQGDTQASNSLSPQQMQNLQQIATNQSATTGANNNLNDLRALQAQLPQQSDASAYPNTPAPQRPAKPLKKDNGASPNGMSEQAFSTVVSSALPMSPEQIVRLHSLFNATQRAATVMPGTPPKPVSRTVMVNLAPGETPPTVRLYLGFITSMVFVDSTGAPWPIKAYDLGNPRAFNISWNKADNILMVQALTMDTVANLMIELRGLSTPVAITLIPDQRAVDYRVDLHVPGVGPNATAMPTSSGLPDSANPLLLSILNGIPPNNSKTLDVEGADCEAWLYNKTLYLRTRYKVVSPGWLAMMSSADGTYAYELQRTPFILLTGHGKTVPIKITGF